LLALTEERRPAGCVSLNGPGAWLRPWPGMDPQIRAAVEHLTAGDYATASPAHHLSGGDQTAASPAHHVVTGNHPPMLFVVGGKERYFPHEHVRELSALLPGSRVVLLPDAEHGFFYDPDSGESAAAQAEIDAFIAAAPPG
ncbi:MAG: hypothetical protein HOY71_37145, partial [Nonomuraea sp.]|nr:hypothetical protein [Nonomuraea sp.]